MNMDSTTKRNNVYGAGKGYRSTGAIVGSQVSPAASSAHDHGHSVVDRQAPGSVFTPGEAKRKLRSADRQESAFLASAMVVYAEPSSLEGFWRACTRSDDEESVASLKSNISVISGQFRGKKRKVTCTAPACARGPRARAKDGNGRRYQC
jgi:hypothetical protein